MILIGTHPPNAFSISSATANVKRSWYKPPMTCMPIGIPSLFNPNGQAVAGKPKTLIIAVYEKLNGFISGSWCNGAAVGWVGYKKTPSSPKVSCK